MNPYNLINPFSPQEQMSWRRWCIGSLLSIGLVGTILFGYTVQLCYEIYSVKKKLTAFRSSGASAALENYEQLCRNYSILKEQIKQILSWQQSSFFYTHIFKISEMIPACVMLESVICNEEEITMEGETQSIETLLGFIHDLNATELFQAMNLIELKPSSMVYDEKKLVNFLIKGKLKGL